MAVDFTAGAAARRRGTLLATVGVLALSFDALLVRLASAGGAEVVFWRGLLMAIALSAVLRMRHGRWPRAVLRDGGAPALLVAVGFAATLTLFVLAVLHTRVANVVVILAAAPLFAALFSGVFLREWVPLRTWLAIALSLAGIALVFGGSVGPGNWRGDLFALAAAVVVGGNFTLLRRSPGVDRMASVALAGLLAALAALPFAQPLAVPPAGAVALAVMGLVQMPVALACMAEATRHLPSAEVALFLLLETVLGTLWVWWLLGEEPPGATLLGGALVLGTLAAHALWGLRRAPRH